MNIFLSAYLLSPAICTTGFFSPRLTCQWWARSSRCTRSPPAPSVSSLPGQGSTAPRAWAAPPGARPGPGPGSRSGQGSSGTRRATSGGPPSALKRNGRRGGGSGGKRGKNKIIFSVEFGRFVRVSCAPVKGRSTTLDDKFFKTMLPLLEMAPTLSRYALSSNKQDERYSALMQPHTVTKSNAGCSACFTFIIKRGFHCWLQNYFAGKNSCLICLNK